MKELIRNLILEGAKEKALEDFISKIIKGTPWEGKVFIAGGYVRDEFMGKDPKDLDILVNAPNGGIEFAKWITKKVGAYRGSEDQLPPFPKINYQTAGLQNPEPATEEDWEKVRKWQDDVDKINASNAGSNPVIFHRFGTAKFNLRGVTHNGIDLSDMDVEAVMPRKEQYAAGSRKPLVGAGNLKDDVDRRDFTVNSLLKDLTTGEILDLTGMGKDDIKAGIIRTPLNPDKIFTDDPLRMLRAVRFAVKYGWKLPLFMMRALKKNAPQLQNISHERIRDELNKMLVTNYPGKAIEILRITGLLKFVIPELTLLIKLQQNKWHKEDAFKHTLDVLGKTQPVLRQRLMALFHDIGKFATKSVTDTGIHFYGHEKEGADIARAIMRRLKYPSEIIDAVVGGIRQHMRLKHGGPEAANVSDKTLREFMAELGETLEDTLDVIHADNIAHSEEASMPNQIAKIRDRLKTLEVRKKLEGQKENLPISGKDLMDMGVPQGPAIGRVKSVIKKAVLKHPNLSREDAFKIAGKVVATLLRRGSLKEGVIKEGAELPPEIAKEADLVTKAAIGWVYSPVFRARYLKLDKREKEHDEAIQSIRNYVQTVKKFHEKAKKGSEKDIDVILHEYYTWEDMKNNAKHVKVHLSKDATGTTTAKSNSKYQELDGAFYTYGDWADPRSDNPAIYYKKFLAEHEASYAKSKESKEGFIYGYISAFTTCEQYKNFRQPTTLMKNPLTKDQSDKLSTLNGYPYVIEMAMKVQGRDVPIFFNVVKTAKDIKVKYPDHESKTDTNVYVYMTLITDYLVDFRGLDDNAVKRKILTAQHESVHVLQDIAKFGITTGLPKRNLQQLGDPDVRGIDPLGTSTPGSLHKEPDDDAERVMHAYRTVEFKSNLVNIVNDFQRMLSENLPRSKWEKGFKMLIEEITGRGKDYEWRQDFKWVFKYTFSWEISIARKNLENLFINDTPKFKQYVKEIYKLLFITPEAAKEWQETQRQLQYQAIRKRWLKKLRKRK